MHREKVLGVRGFEINSVSKGPIIWDITSSVAWLVYDPMKSPLNPSVLGGGQGWREHSDLILRGRKKVKIEANKS